ncbi:hypothetical protein GQX74_003065 [Glossina fuscipes]|nr:hypothetical protein GQX74_003065 [Glossina fuscipes]
MCSSNIQVKEFGRPFLAYTYIIYRTAAREEEKSGQGSSAYYTKSFTIYALLVALLHVIRLFDCLPVRLLANSLTRLPVRRQAKVKCLYLNGGSSDCSTSMRESRVYLNVLILTLKKCLNEDPPSGHIGYIPRQDIQNTYELNEYTSRHKTKQLI